MTENEIVANYLLRKYEEKLKTLMPEDECRAFMKETAKEAFKVGLEGVGDSEFKRFCLKNFDEITK